MGDFIQDDFDITSLEVMEAKMYVHEGLKVIYINEAFEMAIENKESEEFKEYSAVMQEHPDYATRLRRIPITLDDMKRYAKLRRDSYMLELIARKEPVLSADNGTHEVSLFYAFSNMFTAKYPECKNMYRARKHMDEYESKHPELRG